MNTVRRSRSFASAEQAERYADWLEYEGFDNITIVITEGGLWLLEWDEPQ